MVGLYHLFSNGAKSVDLFISIQELNDAMNRIAIAAYSSGVMILGYCIQDTHVHLLVKGDFESVTKFKVEYQRRTRDYLTRRRSGAHLIDFSLEILPVRDESYARNVAAYVICQATKDHKNIMPYDYKWSSAALYFRTIKNDLLWMLGDDCQLMPSLNMGAFSLKDQKRLFHVSEKLPSDWEVCDNIILPSSFVAVDEFEKIFITHNCFRTFCGGSVAKDVEIMNSIANTVGINIEEKEAKVMTSELCLKMYSTLNIRQLDVMKRINLGRELRRKFRMGLSQIARRIYLPEDEVRKYLK